MERCPEPDGIRCIAEGNRTGDGPKPVPLRSERHILEVEPVAGAEMLSVMLLM